jgi:isopenicillin N synthase-like dioxygenase
VQDSREQGLTLVRQVSFNSDVTDILADYGSLTFVFQDDIGGLEVQNPHSGKFHPATPIVRIIRVDHSARVPH